MMTAQTWIPSLSLAAILPALLLSCGNSLNSNPGGIETEAAYFPVIGVPREDSCPIYDPDGTTQVGTLSGPTVFSSTPAHRVYSSDYMEKQKSLPENGRSDPSAAYTSGDYLQLFQRRGQFCRASDIDFSVDAIRENLEAINRTIDLGGENEFDAQVTDITGDGTPEIVMRYVVDGIMLPNTVNLYAYRVRAGTPEMVLGVLDKSNVWIDLDDSPAEVRWREGLKKYRARRNGLGFQPKRM